MGRSLVKEAKDEKNKIIKFIIPIIVFSAAAAAVFVWQKDKELNKEIKVSGSIEEMK